MKIMQFEDELSISLLIMLFLVSFLTFLNLPLEPGSLVSHPFRNLPNLKQFKLVLDVSKELIQKSCMPNFNILSYAYQ